MDGREGRGVLVEEGEEKKKKKTKTTKMEMPRWRTRWKRWDVANTSQAHRQPERPHAPAHA